MSARHWTINSSKLQPPYLAPHLLLRMRLLEKMERAAECPLTLVCAGAGYGKTTLVSTWLANRTGMLATDAPVLPAAWLSLDEYDSDLSIFLRYFCHALRTVMPHTCEQTLTLLRSPQTAPMSVLIDTLSNDINRFPSAVILVLEDYHLVGGQDVSELLARLVRHWPQPLHLVLVTRHKPPLPIAQMRANGLINEVSGADLRFTSSEVAEFVTARLGERTSAALISKLELQTEGWAVGLHLAAAHLISGDNVTALVGRQLGDTGLNEYLLEELIARQPPDVLKFLLQTSILDRFSVPMCEHILPRDGVGRSPRTCLKWLEDSNFLLVPLDDQKEWYRYHHLVQDILRYQAAEQLSVQVVTLLFNRAADWFEQSGLIEEALQCALAAGNLYHVARLMEQNLGEILNREDPAVLRRWLDLLPPTYRSSRPGLLIIDAWMLHYRYQLRDLSPLLSRIDELIADKTAVLPSEELRLLRAQVLAMHGLMSIHGNQLVTANACAEEALALLPESWLFVRGLCQFVLGLAGQAAGQIDVVEQSVWALYRAMPDKSNGYALRTLATVVFCDIHAGRLEKARQAGELGLKQAGRSGVFLSESWYRAFLGMIHYEWNELDKAAYHFEIVAAGRYSLHGFPAHESLFGLMRVQLAQHDLARAQETLDMLSRYELDTLGLVTANTMSVRAWMDYLRGDEVGAWRWADAFTAPPSNQALHLSQNAHLVRARLLLARGSPLDVQEAMHLIDALEEIAVRTHNSRFRIGLLALRSLALHAQKQPRTAQTSLQRAITLAASGGLVRAFLDLGPAMHALLSQLLLKNRLNAFVQRIIAAFPEPAPARIALPVFADSDFAVADLTPRQREILALMAQRLSDKEIARQLGISTLTVNRHAANLYGRLGVSTRWDAVVKAQELGILLQ